MPRRKIEVNRAPVLTLWTAVVAERLGYDREAALSLGKAVACLNAQSKGRRLGIFEEPEAMPGGKKPKLLEAPGEFRVDILGRSVHAVKTDRGVRATIEGKLIDDGGVSRYLEQKFGGDLSEVEAALKTLAKAYSPAALAVKAYGLYEKFRPSVPEGKRGWGAKGELDLDYINLLARGGGL